MKVKELIAQLQEYNPEDVVILAKDVEGNDLSPLDEITENLYEPYLSYSGSVFDRDEDLVDCEPCITLWPIN